jgi:hypothetical protein
VRNKSAKKQNSKKRKIKPWKRPFRIVHEMKIYFAKVNPKD